MAKGKKALASPFVPVEEQPYPIPENWCWAKLQFICEYLKAGGDKPAVFKEEKDKEHPFPVVANGIENDGIIGFTNIGPISAGTVSVSGRGTIGYSILREYEYMPVVRLIVIKPQKILLPKYLKLVFDVLEEKGTGSSIPQLTIPMIKDKFVPLSPLPEQRRIVDRIESLFAKLDEAKEKAQAVVDGFELRKSAILHKAFTGALTEQWRKENGVGLDSWQQLSIDSFCHSLKYGTAKKSEKSGSVVVIRMGNLQQGEIDWTDLAYSNDKDDIEKYRLGVGDVLFNRTNSAALVGKTSIYRGEYPAIYAGYLIKLDYNHDIIVGDFLNYALNTAKAKEYCNMVKTDGVNQSNINAKKIGAYVISVPKIEEQKEIIRTLSVLFNKEQQAKEAAEAVLAQIDTMKKAILARAFRGELGTNDPAEEWAGELIKENSGREKGRWSQAPSCRTNIAPQSGSGAFGRWSIPTAQK